MVSSFRRMIASLTNNRSHRRLSQQRSWVARGVERLENRQLFACLPPSDLALSPTDLDENMAAGTTVGAFTTTDADSSGPFTYSFEGGPSNLDNENFFLTGDLLKTRASLNFEEISSYQVSVKTTDDEGLSFSKTFTISVNDMPEAPLTSNDEVVTSQDQAVSGNVLANDRDDAGDVLTAALENAPTNGTVELAADGNFTYLPNAGYVGSDSFTYTATDGSGASASATVTIVVDPLNDAPLSGDDAFTSEEDLPLSGNVLVNDTDADGDSLSVAIGEGPANGSVILNADGSFTYTPSLDFNGSDSFTYTVNDGHGGSAVGTVNIEIAALNDAPIAGDDTFATNEDLPLSGNVLANDTDVENDVLSVAIGQGPANGSVILNADGSFTYTPAVDFNGSDSFTYMVDDGQGGSAVGTVNIEIVAVNDEPVASDDAFVTNEDVAAVIPIADLLLNDTDIEGDALTFLTAGGAVNGTVAVQGEKVVFTPAADFNGTGSFVYAVVDANGGYAFATVNVSVSPVADAPIATSDTVSTDQGVTLTLPAASLVANDTDADGDALTVTAVGGANGGAVSLSEDTITFTPAADFSGTASFHYVVSDGNGEFGLGRVDVEVAAVIPENTLPVAVNDEATAEQDELVMIAAADLLANDFDNDGDLLAFLSVGDALGGTVSFADEQISFQPEAGFTGAATFSYSISDGRGGTASGSVTVNVTASEEESDDDVLPEQGNATVPGATVPDDDCRLAARRSRRPTR